MDNLDVARQGENILNIKFADKEVTLNRLDPHGLWYFKWESGEPPVVLSGAFTNPTTAVEFLKNYLQTLEKKTRKVA